MDHHPKVVSSSPATRKAAQQSAHSKTLSRNLLRRCNPSAFAISGYQRKLRRTKIHHRLQGGRIRSVPRTAGFRILVLVLSVVFSGFVTTTESRTKKTFRRGIEKVCPHCKQVTKHGFRSAVGPANRLPPGSDSTTWRIPQWGDSKPPRNRSLSGVSAKKSAVQSASQGSADSNNPKNHCERCRKNLQLREIMFYRGRCLCEGCAQKAAAALRIEAIQAL